MIVIPCISLYGKHKRVPFYPNINCARVCVLNTEMNVQSFRSRLSRTACPWSFKTGKQWYSDIHSLAVHSCISNNRSRFLVNIYSFRAKNYAYLTELFPRSSSDAFVVVVWNSEYVWCCYSASCGKRLIVGLSRRVCLENCVSEASCQQWTVVAQWSGATMRQTI